jgi:hypothetical protein
VRHFSRYSLPMIVGGRIKELKVEY